MSEQKVEHLMTNKDYSGEIDAIRNDVKSLRDDVAALLGAFGEDMEQRGEQARAEAIRRLREARNRGEDTLEQFGETIERNPLTALATALGVGFIIGALLGRR